MPDGTSLACCVHAVPLRTKTHTAPLLMPSSSGSPTRIVSPEMATWEPKVPAWNGSGGSSVASRLHAGPSPRRT